MTDWTIQLQPTQVFSIEPDTPAVFQVPNIEEEAPQIKVYNGVDYSRQMGLFNPFKFTNVFITIIGAGAVGSMVAVTLAKQGYRNLSVWDDDVVSAENLPNQFFTLDCVGEKKVVALAKVVKMFTGLDIDTHDARFDPKTYGEVTLKQLNDSSYRARAPFHVIIMATDNMASRKLVWEKFRQGNLHNQLYIDARMGGLVYRVFIQDSMCSYEDIPYPLYSDEEATLDICTEKSIIFNVVSIAATIASWLYKYLRYYYRREDEERSREDVFRSGEIIGDMNNMRVCDGHEIVKLM